MSTVVKDLGAVSAYAYAVEKGYTGTEAEFAELMADYAEVGQRAEDAADSALESKTAAQTAATTATNKASEATTAAQTATTKAGEAQTSAQTASTKAQDASTSAQTASQKATESAQSATNASQSAQTAESAKTASETAQASAESARDDAETARDEAQQYAESIDPQKLIGAYPVDTATGAIASFTDGADNIPMKKVTVRIEPKQAGTGDPSPDNVRPISGWDSVVVEQAGKNLFNLGEFATLYPNNCSYSNDTLTVDSTKNAGGLYNTGVPCYFPSGTVFNCAIAEDTGTNIRVRFALADGDTQAKTANQFPCVLSKDVIAIRLDWYIPGTFSISNFQAELGSTATDYEPYTGSTKTIPLLQTVYGGTLDVTTGELVVDRAMVNLGTLTWNKKVSGVFYTWDLQNLVKAVSSTSQTANAKCSSLKLGSYIDVYSNARLDYAISVGANSQLGAQCSAYAEAADFKSAMNGVQFCYELATPIVYTLTPTEIKSLLGDNNLWADSGDTEVEYRADTKLFIERLTAPDSADMVADANITSGQYFMVGNNLFKATANIANGSAIIVGTNCIRKSLSEALNEINA